MINVLERAREIEKVVMKDSKRKYYRFRYSQYYGGIVSADIVGCPFLCAYCWNYFKNLHPEKIGEFYSSEEVAEKLLLIAKRKNCNKFRISGAEPFLGEDSLKHVVKVVEFVKENLKDLEFIIETNGLILGAYPHLIDKLEKIKDYIYIRISIKGFDEESFEKISFVDKKYFVYPLKALKELKEKSFKAWPAIMFEVFGIEGMEKLKNRLKEIGVDTEIEIEYLEAYPFVLKNLKKRRVKIFSQY